MTIRKPIDIIRQLLSDYGVDDIVAEQIIDALESSGWYFAHARPR